MHQKLTHHRSLEGLRAVAALAVTLFHLELPGFSGGFIGVDIFFVISGFLIGHNILYEVQEGKFKLSTFYAKRARRILPVYFATIFLVALTALWFADPDFLKSIFNEIFYSAIYASNLFYYFSVFDYFAPDAKNSVLLHTWSLSIEEQFYIVFPIFVLLTARTKFFTPLLYLTFLASFILCVLWTYKLQPAAYFLTPFRAWEFLLGVIGAHFYRYINISRENAALIFFVSLVSLILCIVFLDEAAAFPGYIALLPCAATLAMIMVGEKAITTFGLASSIASFFGKLSYSLYMVHWPIVVFAKKTFGVDVLTPTVALVLFLLMIAVALIIHKLVENPIRRTPLHLKKTIFASSVLSIIVAINVSFAITRSDGLPQRFGPDAEKFFLAGLDHGHDARCFEVSPSEPGGPCTTGADNTKPSIVIIGDSTASGFVDVLQKPLEEMNESAAIVSVGGCPPLRGITSRDDCDSWLDDVTSWIAENEAVRKVILVSRWPSYRDGPNVALGDDWAPWARFSDSPDENAKRFDAAVENAVTQFEEQGIQLVVIDMFPVWNRSVGEILLMRHRGIPYESFIDKEIVAQRNQSTRQLFEQYSDANRIRFVSVLDNFCPDDCLLTDPDGFPAYFDDSHPSKYGMAMAFDEQAVESLLSE